MTGPSPGRRAVLQAGGGVALTLLAGCARTDRPTIGFYTWDSYVAPATLAAFEAATGNAVALSTFASDNDLVAKLAAGAADYDVVVPSHLGLARLREAGLVQPLEHARLPALRNLEPFWRDPAYDRSCRFSVPYTWQVTGIAAGHRAQLPLRWADVFAGGSGAGLALPAPSPALLQLAARALGAADPFAEAALAAAVALLAGCRRRIVFAAGDPVELLAAGLTDLAVTDNAAAASAHAPFAVPAAGGLLAADVLAIPRRAPRPAGAHALIDHLLGAAAAAALAATTGYATPNAAARAQMPNAYRADTTLFPPAELIAASSFAAMPDTDAAPRVDEALRRVRIAFDA